MLSRKRLEPRPPLVQSSHHSIRCRRLRPSRSRRHMTSVSPACSSPSAGSSCGPRSTAPDACSTNTFRHPAAVSSSVCRSADCSGVDNRAYPVSDPIARGSGTVRQAPFRHADCARCFWDVPDPCQRSVPLHGQPCCRNGRLWSREGPGKRDRSVTWERPRASVASAELAVDLTAISDRHDRHEQFTIGDSVDHPVGPATHPQQPLCPG